MKFDLKEWFTQKKQGDVIVDFLGDVTHEIIVKSLNTIESCLTANQERIQLRKKVYNVFVECFQNLYHHVDTPPEGSGYEHFKNFGIIVLSKEGAFYRISSGNFIKKEKHKFLKDRIDQLNSLTDVEIKILYRDILSNEEFSKKGGGGLGMLDIVRKTGNKLDYFFYEQEDKYLFFTLDVYIS